MRTPIMTNGDSADHASTANGAAASEAAAEEDRRTVEFRERFKVAESRLMGLFGAKEESPDLSGATQGDVEADGCVDADATKTQSAPKKAARNIDEDDYGDDEDEDEQEDGAGAEAVKPPQIQSLARPTLDRSGSGGQSKDASDPNKQNEDEQEAEEAAKRDFHLYFYTLENDRAAMEEQRQLDKLDQDLEAEVSGQQNDRNAVPLSAAQAGSLSTSNLGASSLMLGNLLKRIDSKRGMVAANDAQLRRLISEVRKNRSKWASEDKVNQEELYEPAEKVLQNLKAMTEYSTPFLQRVSKREASDYYSVIKNPMDIGTMMKKLKTLQYKNRTEIVSDLNLIWNNCLAYNSDPNHPLRKKALYLQKKTDELIRHIPDVEVRSRAEVEAEERKNARMDAEAAGVEDSEDEEPIMASRGRKAPSKSNKGSSNARKAPTATEGTPGAETKQQLHASGSSTNLKNQFLRADSDHHMENGFGTPPPAGRLTPLPNGLAGETVSQADPSEVEGTGQLADMPLEASEDPEADDIEYRMWKQVTKKARATMAVQRHNLFQKGQIAPEQPALLRTKAGMRQWMRQQKKILGEDEGPDSSSSDAATGGAQPVSNETLAEAMEEENDTQLPDYYDPLSAIPEIPPQLRWEDDTEGNVVMHAEETLRMLPAGQFTSPDSILTRKMEANMRQMQETRKVCAKIGVVKQMQLQSQMYSNQFQKYEPQPFLEQDVEPTVVSDEGPFMAPWLCRATFQRSIARIFFHAGFEEFQPSALDAVTDVATSYYQKLVKTMLAYAETTNLRDSESRDISDATPVQRPSSFEENVLHALDEQGTDIEALESYVKDDVERLGTKLGVMHERMKAHLADLLVSFVLEFNAARRLTNNSDLLWILPRLAQTV
jgi:transcriptional activator SPT7